VMSIPSWSIQRKWQAMPERIVLSGSRHQTSDIRLLTLTKIQGATNDEYNINRAKGIIEPYL
jgi:hypothetical protein